jgi:hypothetical protein
LAAERNAVTATKSVKFEISMKELKVSFEGDIQTAERLHGQVTGALTSLASAQGRVLTAGAATPQGAVLSEPSVSNGRRRRRRRSGTPAGIDPSVLQDAAGAPPNADAAEPAEVAGETPRRPRRNGGSPTSLIMSLSGEGFFASRRSIGDVRGELAKKGHSFASSDISPVLVKLTKDGSLKRDQDSKLNQWVYFVEPS